MDSRPAPRLVSIQADIHAAAPEVVHLTMHAINADGVRVACAFMVEREQLAELYRSARTYRHQWGRAAKAAEREYAKWLSRGAHAD